MKKLIVLILVTLAGSLHAITPVPYLEVVAFTSTISGTGSSTMTVYGESSGGSAGTVAVVDSVSAGTHESDQAMVMFRPGKGYLVNF
ncbi:MAG: hypothetical protein KBF26_09785 [Opitutaceae bacterium]|nr:hypothetical protein [Opitutaceae bacterium]